MEPGHLRGSATLDINLKSSLGATSPQKTETVSDHHHTLAGRIDSLDLLRGLAAFAVMIPHFFMYFLQDASSLAEIFSITAVEVFFILSGFVLGPQIMLCAQRRNWATLRTFL